MIEGRAIAKTFRSRGNILSAQAVTALRGVDFAIPHGGAVSFIGESGCGKTTLGRILAGLETFDSGQLLVDGVDLATLKPKEREPYFRRIQLIHQDPYSALNPRASMANWLECPACPALLNWPWLTMAGPVIGNTRVVF